MYRPVSFSPFPLETLTTLTRSRVWSLLTSHLFSRPSYAIVQKTKVPCPAALQTSDLGPGVTLDRISRLPAHSLRWISQTTTLYYVIILYPAFSKDTLPFGIAWMSSCVAALGFLCSL